MTKFIFIISLVVVILGVDNVLPVDESILSPSRFSRLYYAATISVSLCLWFITWRGRKSDKFIYNLFCAYCILMPSYILCALDYVLALGMIDQTSIGYLSWGSVNMLMMATDGMLITRLVTCYSQSLSRHDE